MTNKGQFMALKRGREIEVDIEGLAFGGRGIAKVDGMAVFVERAVPGDRVRARIFKKKKSYAEARIIELISQSPDRISPPCRYSGHCGGCKWQMIPYPVQLRYKQSHVLEAIEHIGGLTDVEVLPILASPMEFHYRNKMEFSCSDRRWLLPEELGDENADMGFAMGLHVPGTFHKVLDIDVCLLQPDLGNHILAEARQYMKASGVPAYGLKSHEGFWRFFMLRHSYANDEWMVNVITSNENRALVEPLARQLSGKYPNIVSVVNNVTAPKAGVATGEYEIHLAGAPVLRDKIGRFEFEISANSFFQTNTPGATLLYDTVKSYAGLTGSETVLDLYCGTGTIGIYLSDDAREVVGMELSESALADAENNCRINQVTNCRFIGGDIKDALADVASRPDVLIIDPPRVGMHKDVLRQVMGMAPEKIVYVSCNPATMARDLAIMKEGYAIGAVQPVDMFPHTHHVENVALLEAI
jgi:23S rRNA (uracil1939-C5)-methyltransferase